MKRGDTLVTAGPSELDALIILADGRFTAVFVQMRSPVAYSPSKSFFLCNLGYKFFFASSFLHFQAPQVITTTPVVSTDGAQLAPLTARPIQTFVPGPSGVAQARGVQLSTGTLAGSGLGRMAPVTGNSLQPDTACAQNNAGHLCSQIQHAHRTMLDISSYTRCVKFFFLCNLGASSLRSAGAR